MVSALRWRPGDLSTVSIHSNRESVRLLCQNVCVRWLSGDILRQLEITCSWTGGDPDEVAGLSGPYDSIYFFKLASFIWGRIIWAWHAFKHWICAHVQRVLLRCLIVKQFVADLVAKTGSYAESPLCWALVGFAAILPFLIVPSCRNTWKVLWMDLIAPV